MAIPNEIQFLAKTGLGLMYAHPAHHFDWRIRRQIYQLFSPASDPRIFRARGRLAIVAAQHVLPIFSLHFPHRDLPPRMLDAAICIIDGKMELDDPVVDELEDEGYHATGGFLAYGDNIQSLVFNADYAAFAAYKALVEIRRLQDPWQYADETAKYKGVYSLECKDLPDAWMPASEFTDEDWAHIAAIGDTAAAAALAFSTSESSPKPDPDKLAKFWEWWVGIAIPSAWEIEAHDHEKPMELGVDA